MNELHTILRIVSLLGLVMNIHMLSMMVVINTEPKLRKKLLLQVEKINTNLITSKK